MRNNLREEILASLGFWSRKLNRPLTTLEIWHSLPDPGEFTKFLEELFLLVSDDALREEDGFYALPDAANGFSGRRRAQDFLLDMKWKKLMRRARWFRHVPFIEFAFAGGSMAFGNVTPRSDFDLLVGVREGRMFTARYGALALFTLLGARRMNDIEGSSPNKLCFNHFVTARAFSKEPHNRYRRELYRHLVPIFGDREIIDRFCAANRWSGARPHAMETWHYTDRKPSAPRLFFERLLGEMVGEWTEKLFRAVALRRLRRYVRRRAGEGRIVISNVELEFHFDLRYESAL